MIRKGFFTKGIVRDCSHVLRTGMEFLGQQSGMCHIIGEMVTLVIDYICGQYGFKKLLVKNKKYLNFFRKLHKLLLKHSTSNQHIIILI